MAAYSKLIGTIIGAIVGIVFTYLATKGIASCSTPGSVETCSIFGFGYSQILALVTMATSGLGTYFAPANA